MKKILGIAILTILGLALGGSLFGVLFWAAYIRKGLSLGISILISFLPFVLGAIVSGTIVLGVNLISTENDDDKKIQKTNKEKSHDDE